MIVRMNKFLIKTNLGFRQSGFTLVEMAVVLVIIGLLLVAGIGLGTTQIELSRITATKIKQEAIKNALISFIARNNRLPCPAVAALAPNAVGYGSEALTPGACAGSTIVGAVSTGIVPWENLGISDDIASDGNYNRFTYQVDLLATGLNSATISGLKGAISVHTNVPAVLGPVPIGNQTNDCTVGNYNPCSGVVTIISHGTNGLGAYTSEGVQRILPASGTDEAENTNADSKVVVKDYSNNPANPFDDIVMIIPAYELLAPLTKNGSLDDYNAALNKNFSAISGAVIAYTFANRTGTTGSGSYPTPTDPIITNLPVNILNDPWGNTIKYKQFISNPLSASNSLPNITKMTDPNNIAFTLSSNGPDGAPSTADDIIKTVYVTQLMNAYSNASW